MNFNRIMIIVAFGLAGWSASPFALAIGLQVSPISVEFSENNNATELWLFNKSSSPLEAQLRVYSWEQKENKNELLPTKSLIVSPPFTKIPAGGKQLVRLIKGERSNNANSMGFYRVVVNELPRQSSKQKGVDFVMEYSVPVFIMNETINKNENNTDFRLTERNGKKFLTVINKGDYYNKIHSIFYVSPTGKKTSLLPGFVGYVLPGKEMEWELNHEFTFDNKQGTLEYTINNKQKSIKLDQI